MQRHDSEDRKAKRKMNTVLLWLYNVLRHEGLTCSATSDVQEDIREANHVRPADVVPPPTSNMVGQINICAIGFSC